MSKIKPLYLNGEPDNRIIGYQFWCPGCECTHEAPIEDGTPYASAGNKWGYSGTPDFPSFSPSINIRTGIYAGSKLCTENTDPCRQWNDDITRLSKVCHFFVVAGNIQYLGDCTHPLKNQTVSMKDI
jgi:hypothetical protein